MGPAFSGRAHIGLKRVYLSGYSRVYAQTSSRLVLKAGSRVLAVARGD